MSRHDAWLVADWQCCIMATPERKGQNSTIWYILSKDAADRIHNMCTVQVHDIRYIQKGPAELLW